MISTGGVQLTQLQAFDAMRHFLEAYWRLGNKSSDDIAGPLGSINRDMMQDGSVPDPALWHMWREAVEKVAFGV